MTTSWVLLLLMCAAAFGYACYIGERRRKVK